LRTAQVAVEPHSLGHVDQDWAETNPASTIRDWLDRTLDGPGLTDDYGPPVRSTRTTSGDVHHHRRPCCTACHHPVGPLRAGPATRGRSSGLASWFPARRRRHPRRGDHPEGCPGWSHHDERCCPHLAACRRRARVGRRPGDGLSVTHVAVALGSGVDLVTAYR